MCFLEVDKSNIPWSGISYLLVFIAWVQTFSALSPDSGRDSVRLVSKGLGLEAGSSIISAWCCYVETLFKPLYDGLKSPRGYIYLFSSPGHENFQDKITAALWKACFYSQMENNGSWKVDGNIWARQHFWPVFVLLLHLRWQLEEIPSIYSLNLELYWISDSR